MPDDYDRERRYLKMLDASYIEPVKPGPNEWDQISPSDFGQDYDYTLIPQVDTVVFWPKSKAAKEFCNRFLPEDSERYGTKGFVVPGGSIHFVCLWARSNNLVSYEDAMNEDQDTRRQQK